MAPCHTVRKQCTTMCKYGLNDQTDGKQAGISDRLRCPSNGIRSDVGGNWGGEQWDRADMQGRKLSKGNWALVQANLR